MRRTERKSLAGRAEILGRRTSWRRRSRRTRRENRKWRTSASASIARCGPPLSQRTAMLLKAGHFRGIQCRATGQPRWPPCRHAEHRVHTKLCVVGCCVAVVAADLSCLSRMWRRFLRVKPCCVCRRSTCSTRQSRSSYSCRRRSVWWRPTRPRSTRRASPHLATCKFARHHFIKDLQLPRMKDPPLLPAAAEAACISVRAAWSVATCKLRNVGKASQSAARGVAWPTATRCCLSRRAGHRRAGREEEGGAAPHLGQGKRLTCLLLMLHFQPCLLYRRGSQPPQP